MLDEAVLEAVLSAERHLAACLAEQDRRRRQNRWDPRTPPAATTVVKKSEPPTTSRRARPAPLPFAPSARTDDDSPEGVPIIVFDGGTPRAWRKGDPTY